MVSSVFLPLLLVLLGECVALVTAFNGRCQPSWTLYNHTCYKLFGRELQFGAAQTACERENAGLVSISDANENDFVSDLAKLTNAIEFWIGLTDILEEGAFQWLDGTQFRYTFDDLEEDGGSGWTPCKPETLGGNPNRRYAYCQDAELDYSNWAQYEPNNAGHNEDCVHIVATRKWNDLPCSRRNMYMCEKDAETEGSINETSIQCPHSFETIIELGSPSKVVNWTEPFFWQRDSSIAVNRSHSPGDRFLPGVTWVNYVISNVYSSDVVFCNFSVTVLELDTTRPKIVRCPDDFTVTKMHNLPLTVKWPPPIATDLADITTTSSHSPGGKFKTGVTNVVYKFTDESGNRAHCSFEISVIEVNYHSGSSAIKSDMSTNRLVAGLYVILCFIGLILVLHLVLKIFRRKGSFNIGEQSYTRINGDAKVEIIQP